MALHILGSSSRESVKRHFRCRRGHEIVADSPDMVQAYGTADRVYVCPFCLLDLLRETCALDEIAAPVPPPAHPAASANLAPPPADGLPPPPAAVRLPVPAVPMAEVLRRRAAALDAREGRPPLAAVPAHIPPEKAGPILTSGAPASESRGPAAPADPIDPDPTDEEGAP